VVDRAFDAGFQDHRQLPKDNSKASSENIVAIDGSKFK
jgi:hypothetical protein